LEGGSSLYENEQMGTGLKKGSFPRERADSNCEGRADQGKPMDPTGNTKSLNNKIAILRGVKGIQGGKTTRRPKVLDCR